MGHSQRESLPPLVEWKTERGARPQRLRLEQFHFARHGISRPPAPRLAAPALTKSKSERRLTYASASAETGVLCDSVTTLRSARRHTVRQKCSAAPAREPPGRMKFFIA